MLFVKLLSRLPIFLLYRLSDFIYFLTYRIIGYRKEVVRSNISKSFPGYSKKKLKEIEKGFYKNLSDVLVETLKALTINKNALKERVIIKNPEVLDKYYNNNKSIVIATTHQCNWEWLLLGCCVQIPYEVDAVYQHIQNDFSRNLLLGIRKRFGAYLIEKGNIRKELIKRKDVLRLLALVADQSPYAPNDRYWTKFLNQDTAFFKGIEKVARMMNMPVLYASMVRVKRGYYEIEFFEIDAPPLKEKEHYILEKYVQLAENTINEHPSDWLWSHKRWKHAMK
jgi:Kdo2-lipid IVA lauroyltransferase/acyltransferase